MQEIHFNFKDIITSDGFPTLKEKYEAFIQFLIKDVLPAAGEPIGFMLASNEIASIFETSRTYCFSEPPKATKKINYIGCCSLCDIYKSEFVPAETTIIFGTNDIIKIQLNNFMPKEIAKINKS